jgi:hypothetical protein
MRTNSPTAERSISSSIVSCAATGSCSNARDRPRRRAESSNLLFVPTVERGLSEPPYQDAESLNMPPDVQSSAVAGPLDLTVSGTAAVRIPASRNLLLEFIKTV